MSLQISSPSYSLSSSTGAQWNHALPPILGVSLPYSSELLASSKIEKIMKLFQKNHPSTNLKALNELLNIVTKEKHYEIKGALKKQEGYFARLFSNESWSEWLEDKTVLGRTVSLFSNYLMSSMSAKTFVQKLGPEIILQANQEASLLLKEPSMSSTNEPLQTPRNGFFTFLRKMDETITSLLPLPQVVAAQPNAKAMVIFSDKIRSELQTSADASIMELAEFVLLQADPKDYDKVLIGLAQMQNAKNQGQQVINVSPKELVKLYEQVTQNEQAVQDKIHNVNWEQFEEAKNKRKEYMQTYGIPNVGDESGQYYFSESISDIQPNKVPFSHMVPTKEAGDLCITTNIAVPGVMYYVIRQRIDWGYDPVKAQDSLNYDSIKKEAAYPKSTMIAHLKGCK